MPVLEDAAQAAGSLGPDGPARARSAPPRTFSFFPSKNLGCFGDGGAITTSDAEHRRARPDRCASTARATRSRSTRSATTRGSTRSRRRSCASSCPTRRAGPTAAGPPPGTTSGRAWASWSGCRSHRRRGAGAGICTWSRRRSPTRSGRALGRTGIGARSYYRTATHEQPAMREFAPRVRCRGPSCAARTNLAIPISPVLERGRGRGGRRGRARRTAARPASTL